MNLGSLLFPSERNTLSKHSHSFFYSLWFHSWLNKQISAKKGYRCNIVLEVLFHFGLVTPLLKIQLCNCIHCLVYWWYTHVRLDIAVVSYIIKYNKTRTIIILCYIKIPSFSFPMGIEMIFKTTLTKLTRLKQ